MFDKSLTQVIFTYALNIDKPLYHSHCMWHMGKYRFSTYQLSELGQIA
jgi:hypothetical protein